LISWVWSLESEEPVLLRRFDLGATGVISWKVDPASGSVAKVGPDLKVRLWPMAAPADADPLVLQRGEVTQFFATLDFHPLGRALATIDYNACAIWPLARTYPAVIRRHTNEILSLTFGPGGKWLASGCLDGKVGVWPLHGKAPPAGGILMDEPGVQIAGLAAYPDGETLIAATTAGLRRISLDDGEVHGMFDDAQARGVKISPDGRLAAACVKLARRFDQPESWVYRVWEVESGEELWMFDPEGADPPRGGLPPLGFDMDGRLLFKTPEGLRAWDPETAETEVLLNGIIKTFEVNTTGRRVAIVVGPEEPEGAKKAAVLDLETGDVTFLETHGSEVSNVVLDPEGTIAVSGDLDGVLRVGLVDGAEPHLLLGHEHTAYFLAVDPKGRWIASGGEDRTVRLWPMPDLSKPPLHTLPHDELIAKLKTLTNLRVVRDPDSPTGWKLTHDPFPGWETVPEW
jgi:WD40 repeat protein